MRSIHSFNIAKSAKMEFRVGKMKNEWGFSIHEPSVNKKIYIRCFIWSAFNLQYYQIIYYTHVY